MAFNWWMISWNCLVFPFIESTEAVSVSQLETVAFLFRGDKRCWRFITRSLLINFFFCGSDRVWFNTVSIFRYSFPVLDCTPPPTHRRKPIFLHSFWDEFRKVSGNENVWRHWTMRHSGRNCGLSAHLGTLLLVGLWIHPHATTHPQTGRIEAGTQ